MSTPQQASNPLFAKASQLQQEGQLAQAEKIYRKILQKKSHSKPVISNLINLLITSERFSEAEPLAERLVRSEPENPEYQFLLIGILSRLGQVQSALGRCKSMAINFPELADVHFNLFTLYQSVNMLEEALTAIQKAIQLSPESAQGYYNLGNLYYALQKYEDAVSAFQKAISLDSGFLSAYINAGYVLNLIHQYAEARTILEKAYKIDPTNGSVNRNLGMSHHWEGNLVEAENAYRKAIEINAEDVESLVLLGNVIRDLGQAHKAKNFYEKALALDPKNEIAQQQLEALDQDKIQSWHMEMLADSGRNKAYNLALQKAVQKGDSVIDIGTGSGLLAMMAARAGAGKVVGFEMVESLANAAEKVVAANGYNETIRVLNSKSTAATVGKEIPEKADILVSEILDCGLLGEGVLPSHRHAVENLLKENGKVIPQAAQIKAVLIESDYLKSVHPIGQVEGFDLSPLAKHGMKNPYHMYHLRRIPHQVLSDAFAVGAFDLSSPAPPVFPTKPNEQTIEVTALATGNLHAVAFWFELQLFEDIKASSGPDGEMIHWGQAVFFFEEPPAIEKGDKISVKISQHDTAIGFALG